jgi:hypothetical protein
VISEQEEKSHFKKNQKSKINIRHSEIKSNEGKFDVISHQSSVSRPSNP